MNIKDLPHVTVEQVLALRKAAIELEIELQESEDIAVRANLRYMEKCKELDLLKQALPRIKEDAVREAIEEAAWYNNRTTASISDMEEYANKLRAGELDDCECEELGSICDHCEDDV